MTHTAYFVQENTSVDYFLQNAATRLSSRFFKSFSAQTKVYSPPKLFTKTGDVILSRFSLHHRSSATISANRDGQKEAIQHGKAYDCIFLHDTNPHPRFSFYGIINRQIIQLFNTSLPLIRQNGMRYFYEEIASKLLCNMQPSLFYQYMLISTRICINKGNRITAPSHSKTVPRRC